MWAWEVMEADGRQIAGSGRGHRQPRGRAVKACGRLTCSAPDLQQMQISKTTGRNPID